MGLKNTVFCSTLDVARSESKLINILFDKGDFHCSYCVVFASTR